MRLRLGVLLAVVALGGACGPKSIEARTRHAEKRADEAAEALDRAQKAADALEPDDFEDALKDAKDALADPDINLYPEAGMHQDRYAELSGKLAAVRAAREKRDLEAKLDKARSDIVPMVQAMLDATESLTPANATEDKVQVVEEKAKELKERVKDEQALFAKSPDFKDWAENQLRKADKALEVAARAKKGLAFKAGPVAAHALAKAKRAEARKSKPKEKLEALTEAKKQLAACEAGARAGAKDKDLQAVAFPVGGKAALTPEKLEKACEDLDKQLEPELKKAREAFKKWEAAEKKKAAKKKK
ncbi:MAG: hypothetical protein AB1938_27600 [Myxococcota bacterium]